MKNYEVLTIGYEGREIDDFISRLKNFNVTRLIDVREVPLSRKRGFSKSAIRERLKSENIEYVHLRSLGCPSEIRYKLKEDLNYDHFFEAYLKYLSKHQDAIVEAYRYIADGVNCIMCFERRPDKCHRSAVVDKIKEHNGNGLKITHI
jgi:uncharacterized protein (DUF488 family)